MGQEQMENTGQKHRPHIKVGRDVDEEEEEYSSSSSLFDDKPKLMMLLMNSNSRS